MVQVHPRSLDNDWSVSVSVARVRGKDEGRVQFPDGPFNRALSPVATERRANVTKTNGLACSKGATDPCKVGALGSIPIRSTQNTGSWSNGTTPARQAGDPGSIPGGSTVTEGSRIRLAGPVC
jgi:hypothetical protein